MKILLISAATLAAFGGAAAWADPPPDVVQIPADPASSAQAHAYTDALLSAVDHTCRVSNNPTIGFEMLRYEACRESERDRLAATEPTGLLAARFGITRREAESRFELSQMDEDFHS
jgi:antirestriction protein ArdC